MFYKNIVIYLMSGTGNTLRAAKLAGEYARKKGPDVALRGVIEGDPEREIREGADTLVGLFPGTLITDGHWIREIINFLYIYPALFILYYIFDLLLRIPVINSVFTYTTLTHIYRRSHGPDTKLKDLTNTIGGHFHVSISHSKKKKY